jgi:hypothetical protein
MTSGTLPRIRSSFKIAVAIDGVTHRRFVDALREGLQLKDQFPQHDVKVRAMQTSGAQGPALH